jgi:hypothetical protein
MSTLPFETDVEHNGSVKIQRVASLPAHGGASDEGRVIYAEDTDEMYVGTAVAWALLVNGESSSIDDIADVDSSGATDGQVLTWNSSTMRWEPADPTGGSGGSGTYDWDSGWTLLDPALFIHDLALDTTDYGFSNTSKNDPVTGVTPASGLITDFITTTNEDRGYVNVQILLAQREDVGAGFQDTFLDITNYNSSSDDERGSGRNWITHIGIANIAGVLNLVRSDITGGTDNFIRIESNTLSDLGWTGSDKGMNDTNALIRIKLSAAGAGSGSGGGSSSSLLAYGTIGLDGDIAAPGPFVCGVSGNIASATMDNVGMIGGFSRVVATFDSPLPNTNYNIITELSNAAVTENVISPIEVISKSTTGFTFRFGEHATVVQTSFPTLAIRIESTAVDPNLSAVTKYVEVDGTTGAPAITQTTTGTYVYTLSDLTGGSDLDSGLITGVYVAVHTDPGINDTQFLDAIYPDGTTHRIWGHEMQGPGGTDTLTDQVILVPINIGQSSLTLDLDIGIDIASFTIVGVQQADELVLAADLEYVNISGTGQAGAGSEGAAIGGSITQSESTAATSTTWAFELAELTGGADLDPEKMRGIWVRSRIAVPDTNGTTSTLEARFPDGTDVVIFGGEIIGAGDDAVHHATLYVPINEGQTEIILTATIAALAVGHDVSLELIGVQQVKAASTLVADLDYVGISGTSQAGAGSTGLAVGSSLSQSLTGVTVDTTETYAYELDQLTGAGYNVAKVRGVYVKINCFCATNNANLDQEEARVNVEYPDGTTHTVTGSLTINADDDNGLRNVVLIPINSGQSEIILSNEIFEGAGDIESVSRAEFEIIGVQQVRGVPNVTTTASVHFDGTVGIGAVSPNKSNNVQSVLKNGTGVYTITWDTPFPDAFYTVAAMAATGVVVNINSQLAGTIVLETRLATNGTLIDSAIIHVTAFE